MKNSFKNFLSDIIKGFFSEDDLQKINPQTQTRPQTRTQTETQSAVAAASKLIQNAYSKIYVEKYEEAIVDIKKAIKLCPLDRDYHLLLETTKERIQKRDAERERERELIRKREEERKREQERKRERERAQAFERELWNRTIQQQLPEEKIQDYTRKAKEYLNNKELVKAKKAIETAKELCERHFSNDVKWKILRKIEPVENQIRIEKSVADAEDNIRSGKYQKAVECAREAMELAGTQYYYEYYRKVSEIYEEHTKEKQQKEQEAEDKYAKQAETHYQNAVRYHNDKNYRNAEKEINDAIRFAKCAGIVSNKFVILKNKILSDKKATSNIRNNYTQRYETNKTSPKNNKQDNHYEGFGVLDDECDEHIPESIAEIIAKKSAGKSNNKDSTNITDKKSEQKILRENNPDELIKVIEDFIKMRTYKNAYDYIEKVKRMDKDKKYAEKLDLLSEKIALAAFEPALTEMLQQNDYESAIKQLKIFAKNKPNNQLFDKKLIEIEKFKELYNESINLYEDEDYEAALSAINDALKLAKGKGLSIVNFEKLKLKIEAEEIYQKMLEIYESTNIDYELIIKKLQYIIKEKYSDERYTYFLKKAVSEYELIQEKNYYNAAVKDYENKEYKSALTNIDKALDFNPHNKEYAALKKKINAKADEIKKEEEFKKYYKNGVEAYNNAEFEDAAESFKKALKLKPDNNECQKILQKAEAGKIEITACTKRALMTLDFINEEQAENIMQARKDGMMWYEYTKFAEQFDIMPHQWADVEEKIVFPLKQANKYGRRLDI